MRRFPILFAFLALFVVAWPASAGERPIVAVFPIQDVSGQLDPSVIESLTEYLSAAVAVGGNYSIQAPGEMKRRMTDQSKESYKECYDEKCQIELGRELAANKMITAKVIKLGDSCTVTAALYDLRTQATDITATADGKCLPAQLKVSLDKVAAKLRAWSPKRRVVRDSFEEGRIGERVKRLDAMGGQEIITEFLSTPPGAVVIVDGSLACEATPCSRKFAEGAHEVSMQKKRYLGHTEQVVFAKGSDVAWELEPTFGQLAVNSDPAGIQVLIDGEKVGKTPLRDYALDPGNHEVLVTSPCHYDQGEKISIVARQKRSLEVTLEPKLGGLNVNAKDETGNDVEAELFVDGQQVGEAPGRIQISVCARRLVANAAGGRGVEIELQVEEGEWRNLNLELVKGGARSASRRSNKKGSKNGGQVTKKEKKPFTITIRAAPTFSYSYVAGLKAMAATGEEKEIKIQGPAAGARFDLFFMDLLGVTLRYEYGFLNDTGLGFFGLGMTYSSLFGAVADDDFDLEPNLGMYAGVSVLHGAKDAFDPVLNKDLLEWGMLLGMDLSLDMVFSKMWLLGIAGEFGYIFQFKSDDSNSSASSTTGAYYLAATVRAGIRF